MDSPTTHPQRVTDAADNPHVASFPHYDRAGLGAGIVHIGVGNFHRAHQARFLDAYLQSHAEDWMIHGIGCLETDLELLNQLRTQDCMYTLIEESWSADRVRVVGALKRLTHAPTQWADAVDAIADPSVRIVSLTVTEKGYYADRDGNLDVAHPVINAELAGAPRVSTLGLLFDGLRQRMHEHGRPVTVLSCDNLVRNGDTTRRVFLQYAQLMDPEFAGLFAESVTFPNSVVDRITPATNASTPDRLEDEFGIEDSTVVTCEHYARWIIEDTFAAGRPDLEAVGVTFVENARPYEQLKIRLLNGSHSALAYVAAMMGYRRVDEAMRNPAIRQFVTNFMDFDVTPTLPAVPGVDVATYKRELLARFSDPTIADSIPRLAMDGSKKIQSSIVPVLEHQLFHGGSIRYTAFALAAWYRYLQGRDDAFETIEIVDPMAAELHEMATRWPRLPHMLLGRREIFGNDLAWRSELREAVSEALTNIERNGTRRALSDLLYDMTPSNPRPQAHRGLA